MKTFSRVLLCISLLTVGLGHTQDTCAQETFAPLVTDHCVAFVHVDFSKVEIDKVKNNLQKLGETVLWELGFDEQSHKATALELALELEKLDILVRPQFETLTKELGIREFAVIFDMDLLAMTEGRPFFAVPWKNKTDKQFETLIDLLQIPAENLFTSKDFLFMPPPWYKDVVVDWAKRITPSPSAPIFEALKSVPGAEIKVAAVMPEPIRAMARLGVTMAPDIPNEVRGILQFAVNKVQWASAAVSLSEITGSESLQSDDVLLTIKVPNQSDAEMLRGMLEQLIDFGVNTARAQMEQNGDQVQVPPLAFQFARGLLRTMLPDVEDDALVFRAKDGSLILAPAIGVSTALLLPAVQAAREAARRMQCTNNLKQIVLALHTYHDANGAFPPLYTVDASGKPLHSWRVLILPFIEQQALYKQIRLDEPWDSEYNKQFHDTVIPTYACLRNELRGQGKNCNYSGIAGEGFVPATKENVWAGIDIGRILDGTSNTLAVVEVREPFCWMDPTADITLDELAKGINTPDGRVGSNHTGGINVGMFDGSVRFFRTTTDPTRLPILRAMGTCAGGEAVWYE